MVLIALGWLAALFFSHAKTAFEHYRQQKDRFRNEPITHASQPNCNSPLVILIIGQSNAANFGEDSRRDTSLLDNTFMLCESSYVPLSTPMCGASGRKDHPWARMATILRKSTNYDCIILANTAIGGASLATLSSFFHASAINQTAVQLIIDFGKIDVVIIQQGESQLGKSSEYSGEFFHFLSNVPAIADIPILLSRTSYCNGRSDPALIDAQNQVISANRRVFPGPNTDKYTSLKFRSSDQCHFNSHGLDQLGIEWATAINELLCKKEALLN